MMGQGLPPPPREMDATGGEGCAGHTCVCPEDRKCENFGSTLKVRPEWQHSGLNCVPSMSLCCSPKEIMRFNGAKRAGLICYDDKKGLQRCLCTKRP